MYIPYDDKDHLRQNMSLACIIKLEKDGGFSLGIIDFFISKDFYLGNDCSSFFFAIRDSGSVGFNQYVMHFAIVAVTGFSSIMTKCYRI